MTYHYKFILDSNYITNMEWPVFSYSHEFIEGSWTCGVDYCEYQGRYIGSKEGWRGETAIVHPQLAGHVNVQFDNLALPKHLTHGWISFSAEDWERLPSPFDKASQYECPFCRNGVVHEGDICPEVVKHG